jgi:hypothetical protein
MGTSKSFDLDYTKIMTKEEKAELDKKYSYE